LATTGDDELLELVRERQGKHPRVPPTWVTRTFSGKVRAIWEFDRGFVCDEESLRIKVVGAMLKKFGVRDMLPGYDESSHSAGQYFEYGSAWTRVGKPVPSNTLEYIYFEAATATSPSKGDTTMPMDVVKELVDKKYPGKWPGDFDIGCRGPLFWVSPFENRDGCVVQGQGMWSFSDRADSFTPWGDIIGWKEVAKYTEKRLGDAADGVYYDGMKYWKRLGRVWAPRTKDDMVLHLKTAGISQKRLIKKGDDKTEFDATINYIWERNMVDGVGPFLFNFDTIVEKGRRRYLNTAADRRVLAPGVDPDPETGWPTLYGWFKDWLIGGDEAFEYLMTWASLPYKAFSVGQQQLSQLMFIAGGPGSGKSLFTTKLLPHIFSGGYDVAEWLKGNETFNKAQFEEGVWYVDDNTAAGSRARQTMFSEMAKKILATPNQRARAMFREGAMLERRGIFAMTSNMDADSMQGAPSLAHTILDKIHLMQVRPDFLDDAWFSKLSFVEIDDIIGNEAPNFAAALLEWKQPNHTKLGASTRYSMRPYHDSALMEAILDATDANSDKEMIEIWWGRRDKDEPFIGNASEVLDDMLSAGSGIERLAQKYVTGGSHGATKFGQTLKKLSEQYPVGVIEQGQFRKNGSKRRRYKIDLTEYLNSQNAEDDPF
jgi:hypothetical protein